MADGDRERWNAKWTNARLGTGHGSAVIDLVGPWLPERGRALDIGGGASSDALTLARGGLEVTVVDVSDIALDKAAERAGGEGLTITTVEADLDVDPPPAGPFDVIVVANFLQRDILAALRPLLTPGGIAGIIIATTTNLERHDKPGRHYLVEPDELPTLVSGLEILHHSEAWRPNGRHEAHLVVHN